MQLYYLTFLFRRKIRTLKRRKENILRAEQNNYDNGFQAIVKFFDYILSFAEVYQQASEKTVLKLETFHANLTGDKANFKKDFDWLKDNVTVASQQSLNETLDEMERIEKERNIKNGKIKEIRTAIGDKINTIMGWNIASAAVSGKNKLR